MHVLLCVCECEFRGRNFFKGGGGGGGGGEGECKPIGFVSRNLVTLTNFVEFRDGRNFSFFEATGVG